MAFAEEIEEAVELGVRINIDNIAILEEFGVKYGAKIPVCVRINPHVLAGGNRKISTGHIDSKFGISIYQMPHVQRIVETNRMKVEGIHMHTGSDIILMQGFHELIPGHTHRDVAFQSFPDFANGHSHLQAALIGPSLTIPLIDGSLTLGTWQQVVAINHDNHPRKRSIEVTIIGIG